MTEEIRYLQYAKFYVKMPSHKIDQCNKIPFCLKLNSSAVKELIKEQHLQLSMINDHLISDMPVR